MKKKHKKPRPWRKKGSIISEKFEVRFNSNGVDIWTFKETEYVKKDKNAWDGYLRKTEIVRGPTLQTLIGTLKISDRQDSILFWMKNGITTVKGLIDRYNNREWLIEQKKKAKREKLRATRRAELDVKKHNQQNLALRAEGKYVRRLDV